MEEAAGQMANAVRFALTSNARTVRLAMLIVLAIIAWQVML